MEIQLLVPDVRIGVDADVGTAGAGVNVSSVICTSEFGVDDYWPIESNGNLAVVDENGVAGFLLVSNIGGADIVDVVEEDGATNVLALITVQTLVGGAPAGPVPPPGTALPAPGGGYTPADGLGLS